MNRFRKSWLKPPYDDKGMVVKDRDSGKLNSEVATALLGVHQRHGSITYVPSTKDIKTLQETYNGINNEKVWKAILMHTFSLHIIL